MIRLATACLISASAILAAADAAAQSPSRANLIEGDFGRPLTSLSEQGSGQQGSGQTVSPNQTIAPIGQTAQGQQASGNPLWDIPLVALAATRDRPLFSPSRRAAAPPAIAPAPAEAPPAPVVEAAAEVPPFTLIGTVVDADQSLAIFLSQGSNAVVRRHLGEEEAGWVLRSIDGRTTLVEKNARQITLSLPARNAELAQSSSPPSFTPPGMPSSTPPGLPPGMRADMMRRGMPARTPPGMPPNMPPDRNSSH